jgi:hypothetical protein
MAKAARSGNTAALPCRMRSTVISVHPRARANNSSQHPSLLTHCGGLLKADENPAGAARAELWACALNGFAQAVPDYSNPFDAAKKDPGEG